MKEMEKTLNGEDLNPGYINPKSPLAY